MINRPNWAIDHHLTRALVLSTANKNGLHYKQRSAYINLLSLCLRSLATMYS